MTISPDSCEALYAPCRRKLAATNFKLGVDNVYRMMYFTDRLINQLDKYKMMTEDSLSATFAALADPTRRAILARLAQGEASVTELAEPFAMSLPAVSKHLKVLERAGLIERSREAQWRRARLAVGPLQEVSDWIESYRRFWDESFAKLDDYLRELQAAQHADDTQPDRQNETLEP